MNKKGQSSRNWKIRKDESEAVARHTEETGAINPLEGEKRRGRNGHKQGHDQEGVTPVHEYIWKGCLGLITLPTTPAKNYIPPPHSRLR